MEGSRARRHRHAVPAVDRPPELGFELLDLPTLHESAAGEDPVGGRPLGLPDLWAMERDRGRLHAALVADPPVAPDGSGLPSRSGPYADAVSGRRVLMTNCWLVNRAGSELYLRDLAVGLLRRGQVPVVWSPMLGPMAEELREAGVQVIEDLGSPMAEPDLVHGQHHDETLAALARFPDRPGLFVQHGALAWQEEAPIHPRLLRYVAVDELCRERLVASEIAPDDMTVIPNAVDLDRFNPRDPLPARPRRALALSNTAREDGFLPAAREACERLGIELDVAGLSVGAPMRDPEDQLRSYDVVFGKARVALEALAVGCAVVVVDEVGLAGMVTHAALPEWLRWNLGRHLLTSPPSAERLCDELGRYDPEDSARCRDHVRTHRDLESMIDALVAEHDRVLASWAEAPTSDPRAELQALSARLQLIGPLRASDEALGRSLEEGRQLSSALEEAELQVEALQTRVEFLETQGHALRAHEEALLVERNALRNRRAVRWVEAVVGLRNGRGE